MMERVLTNLRVLPLRTTSTPVTSSSPKKPSASSNISGMSTVFHGRELASRTFLGLPTAVGPAVFFVAGAFLLFLADTAAEPVGSFLFL